MVLTVLARVVLRSVLAAQPVLAPTLPSAPPLVPFEDLLARPDVHLGEVVDTYVQFHSGIEAWDAGLTRFVPTRYRACQVWSDDQLPWRHEDYVAPAGRLFLRHDSVESRDLLEARPHDRWRVRCRVRELFAGEAWIEIERIVPARRTIPEGTVLHAIRAGQLLDRHAWGMAGDELDRALAAPLPPHARAVLSRAREACRDQRSAIEAGIRMRSHRVREAAARVQAILRDDAQRR